MPDDRRRTRVNNILKGFGTRVQRSVFECDLTPKHFQELKQRLSKILKDDDGLRYYILCSECVSKIEVVSGPPVTQTQLYFVA
jgi:CRISPR-associated endoribonuclease Cas2